MSNIKITVDGKVLRTPTQVSGVPRRRISPTLSANPAGRIGVWP